MFKNINKKIYEKKAFDFLKKIVRAHKINMYICLYVIKF